MLSKLKQIKNILSNCFPAILYMVFLGIVILLCYYAISYFNQPYFTRYQERNVSDYLNSEWRFLYQLLLMVTLSAAIVIVIGVLSLLNALTGRWSKIHVLIIYEHKHKDLVTFLEQNLKTPKIKPFFVSFGPIEHDFLIDKVTRSIKKCNAVLVLPGSEKSFIDAEILVASALSKPLIYLKIADDQRTPDTSFKGYPIFDLKKLRELKLAPLQRFLNYIARSPREVLKNFLRATISFYEKKGIAVIVGILACDTLSIIIMPMVSFFVNLEWEERSHYLIFWGITIATVSIFGIMYINTIIARIRAVRITRQKIRTGNMTYQLLEKGLDNISSDREILYCILQQPLPTRY